MIENNSLHSVARQYPVFLVLGIITVLVGVINLFIPFTNAIVMWHGWLLFAAGVTFVLTSFAAPKWQAFHISLFLGLLLALGGLGFATNSISFTASVLSMMLISIGIFSLALSVKQDPHTFRGWVFFTGLVSILFGALFVSGAVNFTAGLVALFIAIVLFFEGVGLVLIGVGSDRFISMKKSKEKKAEGTKSKPATTSTAQKKGGNARGRGRPRTKKKA